MSLEILNKFPSHKCSLHLQHNPHKNVYRTVVQEIEYYTGDWVSEEEKAKAIEANDFWVLDWYPETPIGSYTLYAHNLEKLLEAACQVEREVKNNAQ